MHNKDIIFDVENNKIGVIKARCDEAHLHTPEIINPDKSNETTNKTEIININNTNKSNETTNKTEILNINNTNKSPKNEISNVLDCKDYKFYSQIELFIIIILILVIVLISILLIRNRKNSNFMKISQQDTSLNNSNLLFKKVVIERRDINLSEIKSNE